MGKLDSEGKTSVPDDSSYKRWGGTAAPGKNLDIEVLRAVAVLMVILEHTSRLITWPGWAAKLHMVTTFWGGVDIFFVISGFVITGLLLRESGPGPFWHMAVPFWIRRIYRIWPSAILWVLLILLASVAFNNSGAFGDPVGNASDAVAAILQVANFHWLHCYNQQGTCGVNTIYWSLSLEEQFYLLFPVVFFFVSRKWLPHTLLAVAVVLFFMWRPPRSLLWEIRVDALALGCFLALVTSSAAYRALEPMFLKRIGPLFVLVVVALISLVSTNRVISFHTGMVAVLSFSLVWAASYDRGYICPPGVAKSVLVWVGSRSYAIYLVHLFAFFMVREVMARLYPGRVFDDSDSPLFLALGLGLTAILAEANFRLLETPLRRRGVAIARSLAARWAKSYSASQSPMEIAGDRS